MVEEKKAGPEETGALIVEEKAAVGMVSQACSGTDTPAKICQLSPTNTMINVHMHGSNGTVLTACE